MLLIIDVTDLYVESPVILLELVCKPQHNLGIIWQNIIICNFLHYLICMNMK